ncbi:hypothetical protein V2I01_41500 [Micromonospora sp. BRA006-A]|nr:hypothetical protein [Micromonospora sp. BRA006-A]
MSDRPEIGVLCLDTSFDKIPGHIRNPDTFDFPVRYRVVEGATPQRLVREADPTLLRPFVDAARDLEAAGVAGITGACGFLVLFQAELAAAVRVPLWSSSLVQLPMVHRMVGRPVGLLVADEAALTPRPGRDRRRRRAGGGHRDGRAAGVPRGDAGGAARRPGRRAAGGRGGRTGRRAGRRAPDLGRWSSSARTWCRSPIGSRRGWVCRSSTSSR